MINYIKAEIYRLCHKYTLYIVFISLLAIYWLTLFMRINTLSQDSILREGITVLSLLTTVGGSYIFASIFNDDIISKSIISIVGTGIKKNTIIIYKLFLCVIVNSIMFIFALSVFCLTFLLIGFTLDALLLGHLVLEMIKNILIVLAYSSIASVAVYGTQKATNAIVTFVLLSTGVVNVITTIVLGNEFIRSMIGDSNRFTLKYIVENLVYNFSIPYLTYYLSYIGLFIIISMVAFTKVELEF